MRNVANLYNPTFDLLDYDEVLCQKISDSHQYSILFSSVSRNLKQRILNQLPTKNNKYSDSYRE